MKTRTGVSDLEYPDGRMAHTDVEKAELLNTLVPGVVYIRLESKLPSCRESYIYDWDFRGCPREPAAL